jgi:GntR family transcriptional regulator/MocR family aminotransferase
MTRLYQKRRDFMVQQLRSFQEHGLPIHFEVPAGGMAIWLDTGKSIIGLKEKLLPQHVYLQTEEEFSRLQEWPDHFAGNLASNLMNDLSSDSSSKDYRFIRLGFAAMDETEVSQGLAIVMKNLYGLESE